MKVLIVFCLVLAVAYGQLVPVSPVLSPVLPVGRPYRVPVPVQYEEYAASLEEAPVGLYGKRHFGGPGYGPYGGPGSEVNGASLGGAKVGLYGKEHPQPVAAPAPVPLLRPRPVYRPPRPY